LLAAGYVDYHASQHDSEIGSTSLLSSSNSSGSFEEFWSVYAGGDGGEEGSEVTADDHLSDLLDTVRVIARAQVEAVYRKTDTALRVECAHPRETQIQAEPYPSPHVAEKVAAAVSAAASEAAEECVNPTAAAGQGATSTDGYYSYSVLPAPRLPPIDPAVLEEASSIASKVGVAA
jgi:hypothetical protein